MSKERLYEIIKIIATAIVSIAGTLLIESCIVTTNVNKNSAGATIESQQSAQQKNDSTNFKIDVK